jgi:small-conductance mechanosensitive channel
MSCAPLIAGGLPALAQNESPDEPAPRAADPGAGEGAAEGADATDLASLSLENLSVEAILNLRVLGNPLRAWLIAIAVLLVLIAVVWLVRRVLAIRVKRLAERTTTTWDNLLVSVVHDVRLWLIFPALVYVAAKSLLLPAAVDKTIQVIAVVGVSLQLLLTSRLVIDFVLNLLLKRVRATEGKPDPTVASSLGVLRAIAFAVIGVIVLMLALDNLGIAITPMLTGLGIGGIAVALAVQNILGDLFGSLTIILDKPFVVGDFIIVGDKLGTVEKIGVKTTRVRALSGEQLVFSNNDLLSSRIQNYKRMFKRRIVFEVGVIYETTPEQLRQIPMIIREAVEKQEKTSFDRSHFKAFGNYSLDFETVYFVTVPDYNTYMDVQQAINLHIFEQFAAAGVSFAYPTQVEVQRVEKEPPPQYLASPALADGRVGATADAAGDPDHASDGE